MRTELTMRALCRVIDMFMSHTVICNAIKFFYHLLLWLKNFNIPSVLSETLIKVTAEHVVVKQLAVVTQTRSWLNPYTVFSHNQYCVLARLDLIMPVSSILSSINLPKIIVLL